MTIFTHDPSLLSLAAGTTLANLATTGAAAGWTLTCNLSTGGTVTFTADKTWRCVGNSGVARLDGSVGNASLLGVEALFDVKALPTGAANRIIEFRTTTNVLRLEHNANGTITVFNAANAAIYTTTTVFGVGRFRVYCGINPSTGAIVLHFYTANSGLSTTAVESWTPTGQSLGTAPITAVRFGRLSSVAASTADIELVNAQASDESLTPLGPLAAATPTRQIYYSADGINAVLAATYYSANGSATVPVDSMM